MKNRYSDIFKKWLFWGMTVNILLFTGILMFIYQKNVSLFKFKTIIIHGNHYIPDSMINELSSIDSSKNILSMNLANIRNNLTGHEYIKNVRVSRLLPASIQIDVIERDLFALIQCKNSQIVVDKEGNMIPFYPELTENHDLPVLKGDTEELIMNDLSLKSTSNWFLPDYNFIRSINDQLPQFFQLCKNINLEGDSITFDHSSGKTCIRLKTDTWVAQLQKLTAFANAIRDFNQLTDYREIDLRIPGQIIVKENQPERS